MEQQSWGNADDTFFATLVARRGGVHYYLIAERLPGDGGWDWIVWRSGDARETARHGYAPGAMTAMAAAKAAAWHWDAASAASET